MRELRRHVAVVDPSERYGVDTEATALEAVLTGYFGTLALYDPTTAEQRGHAEHMLDVVGLSHRRGHKVEKRRCLLARALVHLPELVILDEPTAGLDISGRERLLATIDQLQRLHPGLTVIMVTHHVEEIGARTDQVVLLSEGKVTAAGRPVDVISPESLTKVFGCKVYVQRRGGRWWLEVLPEAWLDLLRGR